MSLSDKSESDEVEEDMDSPNDQNNVVEEMPDDMPLSAFTRKKRRVDDPIIDPKKKMKRAIRDGEELFDLPQVEFPTSFIREAPNSHHMLRSQCCFSGYMNSFLAVKNHLPNEFFHRIETTGFSQFLKEVDIVVNPFHLDDLVGRYIGESKFADCVDLQTALRTSKI